MTVVLLSSAINQQSMQGTEESFLTLKKIIWTMTGAIRCSGYLKSQNERECC